jgi:hypothetical protein
MANTSSTTSENGTLRTIVIAGLLLAAFFGAYRFASARSGQADAVSSGTQQGSAANVAGQPAPGSASSANSSSGGCACCGGGSGATTANGVTGAPVAGSATISGGIQVVAVKVGTTYSPNIIKLKAGIPAEITFGQGGGCTAQIVSQDLGFSENVSAGPRTVRIDSPKKGTYSFSCGMGMVFGQIVVE